ncbi:TCPD-like protein [Mya arenaria]|uniref:T-complex protein 1 subunit delta n=1 Tax=Mya arenaria TaxID=6604 RepID=A0ABY7FDU1_MYAAR|nr:TCPD-like protein [Mya arenaria]
MAPPKKNAGPSKSEYKDKEKPTQIRYSNIEAAKDVTITNDGATILKQMQVLHPAAKMLVELSKAQDVEAGDGTTSVCVIAGSLLDACQKLLSKGIHPTSISEAFQKASTKSMEILEAMTSPLDLNDRESLLKAASTSLNSKVVSQYSGILSPIAVDAVLRVVDPAVQDNVDLNDIKINKKLGGTVEDIELIDGLVFDQRTQGMGGPNRMDNSVVVSDYTQMDKVLREERQYILNIVKQVKKAGCNVLLIQKSILRDAVSDLALHFLAKMKIMVVKDVEREDVEFVCKSLNCRPIASLDHFVPESLGSAELVEEVHTGASKIVKLVLEEADRSLHDALCVIRCLVKKRALIAGGGAPEIELSLQLMEYANTLSGMEQYCFREFAEALEVIPFTLAENAGLNPIATVTELRNRHAQGEKTAGINVRKENVVQPLLVSQSAIHLASETVRSIMKIDDIIKLYNSVDFVIGCIDSSAKKRKYFVLKCLSYIFKD